MNWEKYGYVSASRYRQKVCQSLFHKPKTPKNISQDTGLYLSHVSSTLSGLEEKGIVECLTPSLIRGKIFALTPEGKEIVQTLIK